MNNTTTLLILAVVTVITGATLSVLQEDKTIALLLITTGLSTFGGALVKGLSSAKEEAAVKNEANRVAVREANEKAEQAFSQTTVLRSMLADRESKKKT
jgi:hypothetical protein